MWNLLYNLIVMPIQMVVEITYLLMSRFLGNQGFAIIAVSIVIQTLILPLYKRSDALQDEEREKQKEMEHWVKHIKKTFHGDERFMMLQTYYRQQNYKSYDALKSSVSILLQIPFFMAAYNYLSHLQEIKGTAFWVIPDLGEPDRLLHIFGMQLNMLPIAMTVINIVSGIIYTKGMPRKSKVQVYGLAVVFLVLLYNSPAGLVLYWTMNNIYSLLKNVCMKLLKRPGDCNKKPKKYRQKITAFLDGIKLDKGLFLWEVLFLIILFGFLIPVSVVRASASEFVIDGRNPMSLVLNVFEIYIGVFGIWFSIFYLLMTTNAKKIFSIGLLGFLGVFVVDYMAFGTDTGVMSALLVFEEPMVFSNTEKLLNIVVIVGLFIILVFLGIRKSSWGKQIIRIIKVEQINCR